MIVGSAHEDPRTIWHSGAVSREQRATQAMTIWLTGLPGSGKSSLAVELESQLVAGGRPAYRLDGDNLRHGLNADLKFSPADRTENSRRVAEIARLFADSGTTAIVALVSPLQVHRDRARALHAADGLPFVEVFVNTPLAVCEARDPKGMYAKARAGSVEYFTGVNGVYEAPLHPEVEVGPRDGDAAAIAKRILERIPRL